MKYHTELMPIEQVNGAFKRVVRKSLTGSITGLAEKCIEVLLGLDVFSSMLFSRKSFYTLRCYATGNWDALKKTTSEHKRRRTGHKPSSQASIPGDAANDDDDNNNKRKINDDDNADDNDNDEFDAALGLEEDEDEDE